MAYKIQTTEALLTGWNLFKQNPALFVGAGLINVLLSQDYPQMFDLPAGVSLIVYLITWSLSVITTVGLMSITLRYIRGERNVTISDLFAIRDFKLLLKIFVVGTLYALLVGVGLILFVVPGIYWSLTYGYSMLLVLDKNMGIMESFKKSSEITKGVKMDLLVFMLLSLGVVILGLIVFIVGIIAAIPVVYLANAYIYNQLLNKNDNAKQSESKPSQPTGHLASESSESQTAVIA